MISHPRDAASRKAALKHARSTIRSGHGPATPRRSDRSEGIFATACRLLAPKPSVCRGGPTWPDAPEIDVVLLRGAVRRGRLVFQLMFDLGRCHHTSLLREGFCI